MITSIVLVIVGIVLLLVMYGLGSFLGFIIAYGSEYTKKILIAYKLSYLIPYFAIGYGIYGIVKHLFF